MQPISNTVKFDPNLLADKPRLPQSEALSLVLQRPKVYYKTRNFSLSIAILLLTHVQSMATYLCYS